MSTDADTAIAERRAAYRAAKIEREARYDALQAEEDAAATAEGREPLPVRPGSRRKALLRLRRHRISTAIFAGQTVEQIAAAEGCSTRRVHQFMHQAGLDMPTRPPDHRPLAVVYVAGARAAWLDRLAAEAEVSPAEMAGRIIAVALADPEQTRRALGKLALPKRCRTGSAA